MSTVAFTSVMPSFPVSDTDRAVAFYTDILGFTVEQREGTRLAIVAHDGLQLALRATGAAGIPAGHGRCYFKVARGISGFYSDCLSRGVRVQQEIEDTANGTREFTIVDPDQNQLSFGQPIPS